MVHVVSGLFRFRFNQSDKAERRITTNEDHPTKPCINRTYLIRKLVKLVFLLSAIPVTQGTAHQLLRTMMDHSTL